MIHFFSLSPSLPTFSLPIAPMSSDLQTGFAPPPTSTQTTKLACQLMEELKGRYLDKQGKSDKKEKRRKRKRKKRKRGRKHQPKLSNDPLSKIKSLSLYDSQNEGTLQTFGSSILRSYIRHLGLNLAQFPKLNSFRIAHHFRQLASQNSPKDYHPYTPSKWTITKLESLNAKIKDPNFNLTQEMINQIHNASIQQQRYIDGLFILHSLMPIVGLDERFWYSPVRDIRIILKTWAQMHLFGKRVLYERKNFAQKMVSFLENNREKLTCDFFVELSTETSTGNMIISKVGDLEEKYQTLIKMEPERQPSIVTMTTQMFLKLMNDYQQQKAVIDSFSENTEPQFQFLSSLDCQPLDDFDLSDQFEDFD